MWKENCDNHNFKNWTSPVLVEILLLRYQNLKYSTYLAEGVTKFRNFVTFIADWPTGIGQVKVKIVETRFVVNSCPNWNWLPLDHEIQIGQMWDCCYGQEIKISKNNVNTNLKFLDVSTQKIEKTRKYIRCSQLTTIPSTSHKNEL